SRAPTSAVPTPRRRAPAVTKSESSSAVVPSAPTSASARPSGFVSPSTARRATGRPPVAALTLPTTASSGRYDGNVMLCQAESSGPAAGIVTTVDIATKPTTHRRGRRTPPRDLSRLTWGPHDRPSPRGPLPVFV